MDFHKYILRTAETIFNSIIICIFCAVSLYSVYALWDNSQIYKAAENVQEDLMKYKPEITNPEYSFEELCAINPDVCAWITLDNTNIDYPVLQGSDNLTYLNKDVYGEFALAGSIFLDSRCDNHFKESYSLIYGHHMADSKMFGDLDLYKNHLFFKENRTGTLLLPDRVYNLEIFACMVVSASDDVIFDPGNWQNQIDHLLLYCEQNATFINEEVLKTAKGKKNSQILALTTCSNEYTEARTIVLSLMKPN